MTSFPGEQTYAEDLPPLFYTEGKRSYNESLVLTLISRSVDVKCSRGNGGHIVFYVLAALGFSDSLQEDTHRECSLRMSQCTKHPELRRVRNHPNYTQVYLKYEI